MKVKKWNAVAFWSFGEWRRCARGATRWWEVWRGGLERRAAQRNGREARSGQRHRESGGKDDRGMLYRRMGDTVCLPKAHPYPAQF